MKDINSILTHFFNNETLYWNLIQVIFLIMYYSLASKKTFTRYLYTLFYVFIACSSIFLNSNDIVLIFLLVLLIIQLLANNFFPINFESKYKLSRLKRRISFSVIFLFCEFVLTFILLTYLKNEIFKIGLFFFILRLLKELYIIIGTITYLRKVNLEINEKLFAYQDSIKYIQGSISNGPWDPLILLLLLIPNTWVDFIFLALSFNMLLYGLNRQAPQFFLHTNSTLMDKPTGGYFQYILIVVSFLLIFSNIIPDIQYKWMFICLLFIISNVVLNSKIFFDRTAFYSAMTLISGNSNLSNMLMRTDSFNEIMGKISKTNKYMFNSQYGLFCKMNTYYISSIDFFRIKKTNVSKINEKVNHFVGLFDELHTTSIVKNSNDFCYFLSRTDVVIDLFQSHETKTCPLYQTITDPHFYFIDQFLSAKSKITDESKVVLPKKSKIDYKDGTIKTKNTSNKFKLMDDNSNMYAVSKRIISDLNFSAINLNIRLYQEIGYRFKHGNFEGWALNNEAYYWGLAFKIEQNGFFELTTLLRQLRESGSVPSRFMDAISITEVAARYILGLHLVLLAENNLTATRYLRNDKLKSISFGICLQMLREGKKTIHPLQSEINNILDFKYEDEENMDNLRYFLKELGFKASVSSKPTIQELFDYMVFIRNKTRGHGTPSKVDWNFYVCLDKICIFLVSKCSEIPIEFFGQIKLGDEDVLINYHKSGNPVFQPIHSLNQNWWNELVDFQFKETFQNAKAIYKEKPFELAILDLNNKSQYQNPEIFFKIHEGSIFFFDGLSNKGDEQWISFTTGGVIRPNYLKEM